MNFRTLSILIVADNTLFSEAISTQLQPEAGFDTTFLSLHDLEGASSDLFQGLDLVLLAAVSGDFEQVLRSKSYHGPLLYLIAQADQSAPDTMPLPIRYPVLVQRLRSLAASFWFRDDLVIDLGPLKLRPAFKEAVYDGEAVALTDKEVEILIYLYRASGKIVSRDVLLAEIWGYNAEVSTHTLETHIYRLRQKIETVPDLEGLLLTEAGGYRLQLMSGE